MDLLQVSKSETQTPVLGRRKANNLKLVVLFTLVTYEAGDQDSALCSNEYSFAYSMISQKKLGFASEYPVAVSQKIPLECGWCLSQWSRLELFFFPGKF